MDDKLRQTIDRCNRGPFPLREFIDRTLGPGVNHRDYPCPVRRVYEVADGAPLPPITFVAVEMFGGTIGHTGGLARADFF